jgi:hypothetical protein
MFAWKRPNKQANMDVGRRGGRREKKKKRQSKAVSWTKYSKNISTIKSTQAT